MSTAGGAVRARPRSRLAPALLFSLLAHTLLLCLTFGVGGFGLPWPARSGESPDLRVVLQAPPVDTTEAPPPEPVPASADPQPAAEADLKTLQAAVPLEELAPPVSGPALLAVERPAAWAVPAASSVPTSVIAALPAASAPDVDALRRAADSLRPSGEREARERAAELAQIDTPAATAVGAFGGASGPAVERLSRGGEQPLRAAAGKSVAAELARLDTQPAAAVGAFGGASSPAVERLRRSSDLVRAATDKTVVAELAPLDAKPAAVVGAFGSAANPGVQQLRRASEALRMTADGARASELAQLDTARQDVQQRARQLEAARLEALRQDAQRQEAARQQAARAEAARLEAERQEAVRLAAAKQEAARQDTARQDAARAEAARQEAARAEAGRQEAARKDAARLEAGRIEAARLAAIQAQARAEEEQREARKRAIGRQLDEEAAMRDAQRDARGDADRQRPDWTPARRGRLLGRTDANPELMAYGERWSRKIENNVGVDTARDVSRQAHTDAVVTVAVRSNGSVESITFVRSSGVPAVDDAITRIVRGQENYPAFPPALQRDFDVIEIRRSWHFDTAVRLY